MFFRNGVAYDFYSTDELSGQSGPGHQWLKFPLPNEQVRSNITPWIPSRATQRFTTPLQFFSPPLSGLAFVHRIYIITAIKHTDRHANLQRIFAQYQITNFEWRTKWTYETCNAPTNKVEVYRKMNLQEDSIGEIDLLLSV